MLSGVVQVVGITGSSGSGVAPSAGTHHPVRAVNLKTYKVLEHQHMPEIVETLAAAGAPGVRAALRAGLGAAVARHPRHQLRRGAAPRSTETPSPRCSTAPTRGEPFVRFVRDRLPEVAAVVGQQLRRGRLHAGRRRRARRGRWRSSAPTDNLIKGGAGQAIQNMNLMLGLPETASLEDPGPWP